MLQRMLHALAALQVWQAQGLGGQKARRHAERERPLKRPLKRPLNDRWNDRWNDR